MSTDLRILIVDDSKVMQTILRDALSNLPRTQIHTADHGEEAIRFVETSKVDLILCDYQMPGLNGLQTLRILRQKFSPTELPVLILTSNHETQDKVMALREGANDYLTKPIDPEELNARVLSQLRMRQLQEDLLESKLEHIESAQRVAMVHEKLAMIRRIADGISHELNNPLAVLHANLRWLTEKPHTAEVKIAIDDSLLSVEQIEKMGDEFGRLARIATMNAPEYTKLGELVTLACDSFSEETGHSARELDFHDADNLLGVYVTPDDVVSALRHLFIYLNRRQTEPNQYPIRVTIKDSPHPTLVLLDESLHLSQVERATLFEPHVDYDSSAPPPDGLHLRVDTSLAHLLLRRNNIDISIEEASAGLEIQMHFRSAQP
ncbi:MAG: response regulator [Myxococcota bacterium]